jgi:hypothetical protein
MAGNDQDDVATEPAEASRALEIQLANIDRVPVAYANIAHVGGDALDLHLMFSRVVQPVITTQADRDRWSEATAIDAEVVARVLLPHRVAREVARLIVDTIAQIDERSATRGDAEGEEGDPDGD